MNTTFPHKSSLKVLRFFVTAVMLFCAAPLFAEAPEEPLGDMLKDRFKSESFSLGILLQSQGVFSFENTQFNGGRSWDLGSTRIDFRGTMDRNYQYRVRVYFLSQQQNIDARVGYRFSDNFEIIAGAFKPYLSRELDPSPANLDFVRRARLVGAMMNTLEVGLSGLGSYGPFRYRVGMYNGAGVSGIAAQNDNRFLYTSRLSVVWEPASGHELEAGVNGGYNASRDESVGNTGLTSQKDRLIYGAYAQYDGNLFFGTAEWMQSRFDAVEFNGNTETITGAYLTTGIKMASRQEVMIRWDYLGLDLKDDISDRMLLGWNYYPTSLFSFRINLIAEFRDDEDTQLGLAGVFQYHF